jgi:hypothetical protein
VLLFSHLFCVSWSTSCPGNQIAICNGLERCRWNSFIALGECVVDECIGLDKISCFDKDGCHNETVGCTAIARSCWVRVEDTCTRLPLCRWDYGLSQCLERACGTKCKDDKCSVFTMKSDCQSGGVCYYDKRLSECKFNPCYNLDVLPCTELNTMCTYTNDKCET